MAKTCLVYSGKSKLLRLKLLLGKLTCPGKVASALLLRCCMLTCSLQCLFRRLLMLWLLRECKLVLQSINPIVVLVESDSAYNTYDNVGCLVNSL